ncbi:MAG TPA: TolC family protein [Terriglobia bacterium]|nr:TolC family protein [Terriglobia bacterium]
MNIRRICRPLAVCVFLQSAGYGQSPPLTESIVRGAASSATIDLSLKDAIDRAIRNNLAIVSSNDAERVAAAKRLEDLAELYPKFDARVGSEQRQTNLAAFGFGGFPGVQQVIGPFALFDMRAYVSQPIVAPERVHNLREATEKERAAVFSSRNTRELVVLTALDLYFQTLSSESRIVSVRAQLDRARRLFSRATDLKNAGFATGLDVVRAEVEQRSVEQRLIQATNAVQKQKLLLARAIGLPLDQEFRLSDRLPPENAMDPPISELLERAYANRSDAKALDAQVRAAEEALKAAKAKGKPTVNALGDYGVIGRSPFSSHGTYSLGLELKVPLYDRSIESGELEKQAEIHQRSAERDSLNGRIEFEIRSALLDLGSAREQLQVARRQLTLAQQQLDQSQDRFDAGVTDNLEVVQAQEAVALADEGVIQSLYGFNVSRALLARATGVAEKSIEEAFKGSSK